MHANPIGEDGLRDLGFVESVGGLWRKRWKSESTGMMVSVVTTPSESTLHVRRQIERLS